ncbi:MAG: mannose-1-phosphate guanylyltransferase/mannose-6-phosphate isomerase [Rhodospirillaceae bacterium]|nr:mannose-1-phosphate guanylyltransferase/mannose-6-phosphate isomerase [Rhodospirillaceae bacterium]
MTAAGAAALYPVVLSGGAGTRLWPLSRQGFPKQLQRLAGAETLLQQTVLRLATRPDAAPPLVVCNAEHRFIIAEQLRQIAVTPAEIVLEPAARNTAPAIAAAALIIAGRDPAAVMAVMPSDHVIGDLGSFGRAMDLAQRLAVDGHLVTFGMTPSGPETGYGYIRRGPALTDDGRAFAVARFIEKPDRAAAEALLAAGDCTWNSGIFVLRADRYLEELGRFRPDILAAVRAAVAHSSRDLDFLRLDAQAFAAGPSDSIDYAVMQATDRAAVVPAEMAWSDIGTWSALWRIADKDDRDNACIGDVLALDTAGSYLRAAPGRLVAALGLDDVVVVDTADAVLVAARDRVQDVRALADRLAADGRSEALRHRRVYRPWGYYETIDAGPRFQVKHMMVKPGASLSLQLHHHRAEHWVVVSGTARIACGDEVRLLSENESTYIPLGVRHRLENPGKIELRLVEVQSGSYLGEDDIVRFEDSYHRIDE